MTHASLFSGIGGAEVAAAMLGWENLFHCEINPFGRRVLEYWFPNSASYEDITKTSFRQWRGKVDILSGGFPCQPFSFAGLRKGANDERYLWPHMLRVIQEVRPTWVVGENVNGITNMVEQSSITTMGYETDLFGEGDGVHRFQQRETFTIQRICKDLEKVGYSVQPIVIPACSVGAPHRRDRVFFVAVADNTECRDDSGISGEFSSKETEKWVQEWYDLSQSSNASDLRPKDTAPTAQDSDCLGDQVRRDEVLEDIKRQRNSCSTSNEWRTDRTPSDTGDSRHNTQESSVCGQTEIQQNRQEKETFCGFGRPSIKESVAYTNGKQSDGCESEQREPCKQKPSQLGGGDFQSGDLKPINRWRNFPTQSPICRGDDGLSGDVDNLTISAAKWRKETLKAYGNAIVPQVIYEIFRHIEIIEQQKQK